MSDFWGTEDKFEKLDLKTPEQQKAYSNLLNNPIENSSLYGAGSSYLQNILGNGPNAFSGFNAPYLQNFQQQVIPQISERFAGMGTGAGALNSSALGQQLGMASSTLQNNLAQLREQIRGQASGQALQYAQQPYSNTLSALGQNQFENVHIPGQPGAGQAILGGAIQLGSAYLSGGLSSAAGAASQIKVG